MRNNVISNPARGVGGRIQHCTRLFETKFHAATEHCTQAFLDVGDDRRRVHVFVCRIQCHAHAIVFNGDQ